MKYRSKLLLALSCLLALIFCQTALAEMFIRSNHLGYSPERDKIILVMTDSDQSQSQWQLINQAGDTILQGQLGPSIAGVTVHTPKAFNYQIDLSQLKTLGQYQLSVGDQQRDITIADQPYKKLLNDMLRHLKTARSGTSDTLLHPASHLGDSKAILYQIKGQPSQGQWQATSPPKTIDMQGGWYDAGDYIKFTLTTAYTTYYLLSAYQANPSLFDKKLSKTKWVDVLDEAKHGLDYLLKTLPSQNQFIIQVSTGLDHKEGFRLPQNDSRDGKREALSAISPAHMGYTAAALALGANLFEQLGDKVLADQYHLTAIAIYQRARQSDALKQAAFERDITNDFYRDPDIHDNLAMAAYELFKLTGQNQYLQQAIAYADIAGNRGWASWGDTTSSVNYRLAPYHASAKTHFLNEMHNYQTYDSQAGNIWGVPMRPYWGPMLGQFIVGAYSGLAYANGLRQDADLLWDNLDYFLGRNSWGKALIISKQVPNSVENLYSQIYQLTGEYPTGAVSEGPGDKATFESLKSFFPTHPSDAYYYAFNTEQQIFFDNPKNFQTMENTITIQAAGIYMLAVANQLTKTTPETTVPQSPVETNTIKTRPIKTQSIENKRTVNTSNASQKQSSGSLGYLTLVTLLSMCIRRRTVIIQAGEHK